MSPTQLFCTFGRRFRTTSACALLTILMRKKTSEYMRRYYFKLPDLPLGSMLHFQYGVALARTGVEDLEAKRILRDVFRHASDSRSAEVHSVEATIYLARVLRRLGEDDDAQIW
jgi:hypothetical protein